MHGEEIEEVVYNVDEQKNTNKLSVLYEWVSPIVNDWERYKYSADIRSFNICLKQLSDEFEEILTVCLIRHKSYLRASKLQTKEYCEYYLRE